jgi:hypothetical protein
MASMNTETEPRVSSRRDEGKNRWAMLGQGYACQACIGFSLDATGRRPKSIKNGHPNSVRDGEVLRF